MLYLEQQMSAHTRWAIWKIEETEEELLSLFSVLREEYQQEIQSYKSLNRRLEYLAVRALLFSLLKSENRVLHDADGRPSLEDKRMKISISHTKGYAAVILSETSNVGIDIEVIRDKVLKVKHKFLSISEQEDIEHEKIGPENELQHSLLRWCAKETVFKMADTPLPEFAEQIVVEPFSLLSETGVFVAKEMLSGEKYHMRYLLTEEFAMTYCENIRQSVVCLP